MNNSTILNNDQIEHKIKRIAYQIFEANADEKEIIIAGIVPNGLIFANKLKNSVEQISKIKVTLCEVHIDKENPLNEIQTSLVPETYQNKSLVLVDDVLNSGSTLMYGVKHFLEVPLKNFKTAVLVNRNHKKYPVKADFKGISLATTLQDNITVEFNTTGAVAYLG
ncbi:MAG: phosphoribosyltransferase [Flavobacteriaceae bacterium]|nr:phosphoribosyltransferase [Flavobacteriaceae bacterium]